MKKGWDDGCGVGWCGEERGVGEVGAIIEVEVGLGCGVGMGGWGFWKCCQEDGASSGVYCLCSSRVGF